MIKRSCLSLISVLVFNAIGMAQIEKKFEGIVRPVAVRHFQGAPSIDWPVTAIHFSVGDSVKKGDILLELDPAIQLVQVAKAKLIVAEKRLLVLQKGLPAHRNLYARCIWLKDFMPTAISGQEMDTVSSELASYEARIEVAQAEIAQADIELSIAQFNYDSYQMMISPINGEVVAIHCTLGMVARAEKEQLVWIEVVDLSVVEVQSYVPWQEAEKIRSSENRQVFVQQGNHILPGTIIAVPSMANNSGMVLIIVRVNNPDLKMIPGAKAWIIQK